MPERANVALLRATSSRVLVTAHRGAWGPAPENSLAAIDRAIALSADIVELDVRATADEALVLHHDPSIDRMCGAKGVVHQMPVDQLRGLSLRQADGRTTPLDRRLTTSEALPTLSSALEFARDRIIVNLDAKDKTQASRIAELVVAAGMTRQVFVKASIRNQQDIDNVRQSPFFGRVCFIPMMRARPGGFARDLRALRVLNCPMYEVEFDDIAHLSEGLDEIQTQGARLWVNTIAVSHSQDFNDELALRDPDAVWGQLLRHGVDAIQTDEVEVLIGYLTQVGRR
jgi:glycerophosphoryl diester phosphodiesterase